MIDELENAIPLQRDLVKVLSEFQSSLPIWGVTLFTVDGYVIAHQSTSSAIPDGIDTVVGSMSAGLITIAEDLISFIRTGATFNQILIDSDQLETCDSFSLLLRKVADNTLLACVFPNDTQLGLVAFEVETLSKKVREIMSLWDIKLHSDTLL